MQIARGRSVVVVVLVMIGDNFYTVELNRTTWEVPKRYTNLQQVGCGAYGQVASAEDTDHRGADGTCQKVAIKKLSRPFQSAVHAKRTFRELKLLKHMQHENVSQSFSVKLMSIVSTQ